MNPMARLGFPVLVTIEPSGVLNDCTHRSSYHHQKKNDQDLGEIRIAGSLGDGGWDQGETPLVWEGCMDGHLQCS